MSRSTKQDWVEGPGDLKEDVIEDCPVKGKSVKVRALPAKFANEAQTEATEVKATPDGGAVVTVNKAKMEALQLLHGMIEPKLDTVEEAETVTEKWGPAVVRVIEKIDELSAIDKEAIEKAQARFPSERGETPPEAPEDNGDSATPELLGPDVPVRAGGSTGEVGP